MGPDLARMFKLSGQNVAKDHFKLLNWITVWQLFLTSCSLPSVTGFQKLHEVRSVCLLVC